MNKPLRIAKWNEVYERAESRKLKSLNWVSMPIGFNSSGFHSLLNEFESDAPAIYGAWCALVSIAATCTVRGILCNSKGMPLPVSQLSRISGFPQTVFERLIKWASSEEVSWLIPAELEKNTQNTEENSFRGIVGGSSGESPEHTTEQNRTEQNIREEDTTEHDSGLFGRCWSNRFDWSFDEFNEEAKRFKRVSCTTLSLKQLTPHIAFGMSIEGGIAFLHELADTMRNAEKVRNHERYIIGSIRKVCDKRGIDMSGIQQLAIERFTDVLEDAKSRHTQEQVA